MSGTVRFYEPVCWLDYSNTHAIMCAWYYTSWCIQQNCQMHFIACSQVSSQDALKMLSSILPIALDNTLLAWLTIRFQLCSPDTPKYILSMLPSTLPVHSQEPLQSMFSTTLFGMLSRTLPIALDGTLPACLTVYFQVRSQEAVTHISKIYFSLWEPPEVSERMWSVNLDALISGEYQTIEGHSGWPSQ